MDKLSSYDERAKKLKHNKDYYFAFIDMLSDERTREKIKGNTPEQYANKVVNFLEYFDGQGLSAEKITKDKIYEYAEKSNKNINTVFRSALKRFFAVVDSPLITINEIDTLKNTKSSSRKASPLSMLEIIEIRNKLKVTDEYKFLFLFEVFFTYGIRFDEFKKISKDNFNLKEYTFVVETGKTKTLSKTLSELLATHNDLPKTKVRGTLQGHIRKIGELIKRDKLIWQDIIATREKYFPLCPKCEERYPNTEDFWVLLENKFDESKTRWLLCKNCAKELLKVQFNE